MLHGGEVDARRAAGGSGERIRADATEDADAMTDEDDDAIAALAATGYSSP